MDARTKRINEAERFLCEVGFADSRNYSASDLAPLMADFSLKSHSWIKITDDPQTLPKHENQVETTDGKAVEMARLAKPSLNGFRHWTNQHIIPTYWREIPAPPPESQNET